MGGLLGKLGAVIVIYAKKRTDVEGSRAEGRVVAKFQADNCCENRRWLSAK